MAVRLFSDWFSFSVCYLLSFPANRHLCITALLQMPFPGLAESPQSH